MPLRIPVVIFNLETINILGLFTNCISRSHAFIVIISLDGESDFND